MGTEKKALSRFAVYNLIVWQSLDQLGGGPLELPLNRFLEYTPEAVREQFRSLSREAIRSIVSWPTLLMEEGRGEEHAHVVRLESVGLRGTTIVTAVAEHRETPILNGDLWKLRDRLDIAQFEFSRSHWAVKDRDLLRNLREGGHQTSSGFEALFGQRPLPGPDRSTLIEARNRMSEWGHTDLDDLLLEAGVEGLHAERSAGSRRDRANAIIKFVLENPGTLTAEGRLFSTFLAGAADVVDEEGPPEPAATRVGSPGTDRSLGKGGRRESERVFIVHGRSDVAREKVSAFIAELGLQGIVLHDQPNMGRHLLTKFIEEAELVTFAVVLMTDDDVGGPDEADLMPRARQNVILELGYFLSHLGQPRVCALITPGLDTPSDFDGIVCISMADDGHWKRELRRELVAAELPVVGET